MKIILGILFIACFLSSSAQKLNVQTFESILLSSFRQADSILKSSKFNLADKETGEGYLNYYYTSYEKMDSTHMLIRSISLMDVYKSSNTSRMVLYRTYSKKDQDDFLMQLIDSGYTLSKQYENNQYYTKGNISILTRITEKVIPGKTSQVAYEFESGR